MIDDRPEFNGARTGHAPGTAPDAAVLPVPLALAEAVIRREVDRHNNEPGRRSQGASGRSYRAVFDAGLEARIVRKPKAAQDDHAGLVYRPASVDRFGRVKIDTWTYGGPETQAKLLPWHKRGPILVERDPDDFAAPAVAFDDGGRLIARGIAYVRAGACGSVDSAREASKNRKAARQTWITDEFLRNEARAQGRTL